MFELGLNASRELKKILQERNPEEECSESTFMLENADVQIEAAGTIITESPLAYAIISSGANCIAVLSPTIYESEISSLSVFLEKRLGFFRSYSFEEGKITFTLPESNIQGCSAFLSDPNFPTGKALNENDLRKTLETFSFLIIDATYSFLKEGESGNFIRREHANLLMGDSKERVALILRLHEIFRTARYPAYAVLSGSSRFMETFLMLAGWKRNGISCSYKEMIMNPCIKENLKLHAEKVISSSQRIKLSLAEKGWEVFSSDTPYFLAKGGSELPENVKAIELSNFLGIPPDVKLFLPSTPPEL